MINYATNRIKSILPKQSSKNNENIRANSVVFFVVDVFVFLKKKKIFITRLEGVSKELIISKTSIEIDKL